MNIEAGVKTWECGVTVGLRTACRLLFAIVVLLFVMVPLQVKANDEPGADVVFVDDGREVSVDNGIVAFTVDKEKARVVSYTFRGRSMLTEGKRGGVYFSMDGGDQYREVRSPEFSVRTRTADMVDLCFREVWNGHAQPLDIELHYVLRRGVPGIYAYALLDHPAGYPDCRFGEWRMVWRTPTGTDDWICVDENRHWLMPSPEDYRSAEKTPIKEILKITKGARAGHYDCKYDFNASYYDLTCWGHAYADSKVGAWIVCGGYDFFNDGPTKQDLNAAAEINHIHFGMNHYNGSDVRLKKGEAWSKIYGPFLLYCNEDAAGVKAMWADAKKRVREEMAAWPYEWLRDIPEYPAASERGMVTGRLEIRDSLKPELNAKGAWVGLAQPDPGGNWQFESKRYQYWRRADAQGRFAIPDVRPGIYTLYAFTDGAVGEFSKRRVEVRTGATTELGSLVWRVPRAGSRLVWEIGKPDRTAREFRHGGDYIPGFIWDDFGKVFDNPLEYVVGKSDPARDWNYAHSWYPAPGTKRNIEPWRWRIRFDLDRLPTEGDATLTLAIASSEGNSRIEVYVNDEEKLLESVVPSVRGGNALLRQGNHCKYCVERVTIPEGLLRDGENVITLVQPNAKGINRHVMYDYLSLER